MSLVPGVTRGKKGSEGLCGNLRKGAEVGRHGIALWEAAGAWKY